MKRLSLTIFWGFLALTRSAAATIPTAKITEEMDKQVSVLLTRAGWISYIQAHPELFKDTQIEKDPFVNTEDLHVKIDNDDYTVGVGARSIYISAPPKVVVSVIDNPKFFQSLYGLDKPADTFPLKSDGSYEARIFKVVPGIETQDFILNYQGHWEKDAWIGLAKMVEDKRGFALRTNIKIVAPKGTGSIYHEVALFYPLRWWMRLFHGAVQSVTRSEMTKLNKAIKCAAEKVAQGAPMSNSIGKNCHREASR